MTKKFICFALVLLALLGAAPGCAYDAFGAGRAREQAQARAVGATGTLTGEEADAGTGRAGDTAQKKAGLSEDGASLGEAEAREPLSEGDGAEESFSEEITVAKARPAGETAETALSKEPEGNDNKEADRLLEEAYAYTKLSPQERELYVKILHALLESAVDVPVGQTQEAEFEKVFQCVMNDHPEIFYVDGYTFIQYSLQGNSFSGSYVYDRDEIADRTERLEEKARGILAGMPAGGEYEKVKYIYEYLVTHTEYVQNAADDQNICSVLLSGRSVCQGYAKAMQYLLQKAGIFCIFVSGKVESGENHAWNMVRIDGKYYYVDATWGDASYVASGSGLSYGGKLPEINYEYLCVTDEQLFKTHRPDRIVPLPRCVSMEANYYVREGAYFTKADMEKAEALFERAYKEGSPYVTLKCADPSIYQEMYERLVEQQQVFRYLHTQDGTVAYTDSREQLALSFWL